MRSIQLPGTSLSVSRFIFGTGSLHHVGDLKEQAAHLQAAADAGFRHFDTAPLYGFGQAEEAVGLAFDGKSTAENPITLTTKVGLYPPGGEAQSRAAMLMRKVIGKAIPLVSRPQADWSVKCARESLDASLRRLRREHVDLLLLHEPDHRLIDTDEWLRWLEQEAANRVRHFGVCGEISRLMPFIRGKSALAQVVQAPDSIANREADQLESEGRFPQLTYGYLSSMSGDDSFEDVLCAALARNKDGAILVSTRTPSRLGSFADLAESESSGQS